MQTVNIRESYVFCGRNIWEFSIQSAFTLSTFLKYMEMKLSGFRFHCTRMENDFL